MFRSAFHLMAITFCQIFLFAQTGNSGMTASSTSDGEIPIFNSESFRECPGDRSERDRHTFQQYTLIVYGNADAHDECFEIVKGSQRVFVHSPSREIGSFSELESAPMGTDINADGEPDLAIREWTGGSHCCSRLHLFQIGNTFRKIQTIEAGHSDEPEFEFVDLDGDSSLEFRGIDWTFAYWRAAFAFSPTVEVISKFDAGEYRFTPILMRQMAPSFGELQTTAATVKELYSQDQGISQWWSFLWSKVLQLIYSGNAPYARQLIDLAWPSEILDEKSDYIDDFVKTLSLSQYYQDVVEINNGRIF
jgi:hypothetical protein